MIDKPALSTPPSDRRRFAITLCLVLVLLGALHNGYWIRSGDGEAYLAIARSLAVGDGYRFNGNPVVTVPPLWPMAVAAGIAVHDGFQFLKLIPLACVTGGLACWFWVLTRLAGSAVAMTIVLTLAILGQVFPLAITFHSDGAFFLLTSAAMLLATGMRRHGPTAWRIAALSAVAVASVGVRWNGVPAWSHPAAILATGDRRPTRDRRWLAILLSGLLTLGAFFALRHGLKVDDSALDRRYSTELARPYDMLNVPQDWTEYADRALNFGRWPGACLWHGLTLARPAEHLTLLAGWVVIAALMWRSFRGWRTREWIWLSILAHLAFLTVIWPNAVARYALPLAPLFILALLRSIDDLIRTPRLRTLAAGVVLGSIWLLNAPLYAVEVWVQRSGQRVSERAHAGLYAELSAIAAALRAEPSTGEVAITRLLYGRGGRAVYTSGHMRALHLLIDRAVMMPPDELCGVPDPANSSRFPRGDGPSTDLHAWCRSNGVTHFVDLDKTGVLVHFRADGDEQRRRWRLYRVGRDGFEPVMTEPLAPLPRQLTKARR